MILTDKGILAEIEKGTIVIEPYDREYLGTNSYDVHLSKYFAVYDIHTLDAKKHNTITHFEIPEDGFVLQPGTLSWFYIEEYTETHAHVPFLEGKSVWEDWVSTFMQLPEKVTLGFAITGHSRFPVYNRFVFMQECRLANSSILLLMAILRMLITKNQTLNTINGHQNLWKV
jgi:hypothetical protein